MRTGAGRDGKDDGKALRQGISSLRPGKDSPATPDRGRVAWAVAIKGGDTGGGRGVW